MLKDREFCALYFHSLSNVPGGVSGKKASKRHLSVVFDAVWKSTCLKDQNCFTKDLILGYRM